MQNISSGDKEVGDYSDEKNKLPIISEIRKWVGLPLEQYSQNVDVLIEHLQEIDNAAEESMTHILLNDNLTEHFSNGMYAREVTIPAGTALVSRIHMEAGISVLAQGTIAVMDRKDYKELSAPYTFTSPEGTQRIGLTLTECTWVSIFKADKQDGDMLDVVTAPSLEEYMRRKKCQDSG